jgi:hypothetical protein
VSVGGGVDDAGGVDGRGSGLGAFYVDDVIKKTEWKNNLQK